MIFRIFLKPLIWLAIICYGLFIPASGLPKKPFLSIPHFDKLVHFGLFFVFCLLLFVPFKKLKLNHFFYAPAVSLFLAAVLEGIQHMVSSSRYSNFYDFVANSAGIAAATIFFLVFISGRKWEKYA
jgi:VanZ family protein